jgi:hypothetical protein
MHRMHASSSILLNHHRYDGKKEIFNKIGVYDRSDDLFVIVYYFEVLRSIREPSGPSYLSQLRPMDLLSYGAAQKSRAAHKIGLNHLLAIFRLKF